MVCMLWCLYIVRLCILYSYANTDKEVDKFCITENNARKINKLNPFTMHTPIPVSSTHYFMKRMHKRYTQCTLNLSHITFDLVISPFAKGALKSPHANFQQPNIALCLTIRYWAMYILLSLTHGSNNNFNKLTAST